MGRILPSGVAFQQQPGYQLNRYARPTGTLEQLQAAEAVLKSPVIPAVIGGLEKLGGLSLDALRALGVQPHQIPVVGPMLDTPEARAAEARRRAAAEAAGIEYIGPPVPEMQRPPALGGAEAAQRALQQPERQLRGDELTSAGVERQMAYTKALLAKTGKTLTPEEEGKLRSALLRQAGVQVDETLLAFPGDDRMRELGREEQYRQQRYAATQGARGEKVARATALVTQALRDGASGATLVAALMRKGAPQGEAVAIVRQAQAALAGATEQQLPEVRPDIVALQEPVAIEPTMTDALVKARAATTEVEEGEALRMAAEASKPESFLDMLTGAHRTRAALEVRKLFSKEFSQKSLDELELQRRRVEQGETRLAQQRDIENAKLKFREQELAYKRTKAQMSQGMETERRAKLVADTELVRAKLTALKGFSPKARKDAYEEQVVSALALMRSNSDRIGRSMEQARRVVGAERLPDDWNRLSTVQKSVLYPDPRALAIARDAQEGDRARARRWLAALQSDKTALDGMFIKINSSRSKPLNNENDLDAAINNLNTLISEAQQKLKFTLPDTTPGSTPPAAEGEGETPDWSDGLEER